MKTTSTIIVLAIAAIISLFSFSANAQCVSPKLVFANPVISNAKPAGAVGTEYKFTNVSSGVDAYITIKSIAGGASLVNMDDVSTGYYNAWQPVVNGPAAPYNNESFIEWEIKFKTSSGSGYTYSCLDMSAIDVDGDNVRIREFIESKGHSSYEQPVGITTVLSITNDLFGFTRILGPVSVRNNIDTTSNDVRMNFFYQNQGSFTIKTGSKVNSVTLPGTPSTSRYHSLYFQRINNSLTSLLGGVLPVVYSNLNATLNNGVVNVNWATSHETNNSHFEIERSFDNQNFTSIGVALDGMIGAAGIKSYQFADNSSSLKSQSVVYYRLKQVDVDGKATYSTIMMVRLQAVATGTTTISTFPNPFAQHLEVRFTSNDKGLATIKLISAAGQPSIVKQVNVSKGFNAVQLQGLNALASGIYIAQVSVNGVLIGNQRVIKN